MGIQAHFLQDKNQEKFYPYGHADAVFDRNGEKVGDRLNEIDKNIEELKDTDGQSDWNESDTSSKAYIKNKPTSMPASDVYSWAKSETKPSYSWDEIQSKPSSYTPSSHTHENASDSNDGFMSSEDKTKLDGISDGANKYVHPSSAAGAKSSGLYKIETDANGHVVGASVVTKSDITSLGIPGQDTNTTYTNATSDTPGLMSNIDKSKLDGIDSGANKTVVDTSLNSTSTNPVQNKVVNSALSGKVPTTRTINGKALSENITLVASDLGAISTSQKGATNGVAELDNSGKVPSAQLPSFVDDVVEGYLSNGKFYKESGHTTEIRAESGKIYVDLSTNKTYRWSGSAYAEISASLALGETSTTAYRGDRGKIAYDHSQKAHAPSNAEANVQSDWTVTDTGSDAYIKNKPTSLPANGGNASTVNGHTVQSDVPANAVFTDTKPVVMKGATASTGGTAGYVPAPVSGANVKYLRGDGTWQTPPDTNTTYGLATTSSNGLMSSSDKTKLDGIASGANKYTHPSYTSKANGLYKVTVDSTGHVSSTSAVTKSDITSLGIPGSDTNTWIALKGATSEASGTAGYVPAPSAGSANRYLRSDGTWAVPPDTNTTYSNMSAATASTAGKSGLVPAPGAGSQSKYLRGDGTWQTPPNTTYSTATTSTSGLMSASDKSKLDGIASGANKYTLPTASSSTLGGVKTTSTVTSASGLTPCPIISGVPYYKDTNTTYTLSSFGITATAAELNKLDGITATATELNYVDGVTSNVQTQLNGKANLSHTHNYAGSSSAGGAANSVKSSLIIKLNGGTTEGTNMVTFNGETAKTINVTPSAIGAAATSHGTHVSYGSDNPKANGTASAGTATTVSRSDHVHPLQTTVSGNAGSATKLATARTIDGVSFNGSANITHFGTCSTAAATAAKVVSCTGFTLASGAKITVKFTVTNTAANPTLNVNSTGAKAIMYRGAAISAGYLAANRVYTFVYDGTDYELIGDINTTYTTGTSSASGLTKLYTSTGTNTDGTMTQDAITDALAGKASSSHNHSATNITSGTLGVARGGTGVTSNPSMLVNLGSTTATGVFAASPRPGITGTLAVSHGGTGGTTSASARTNIGAINIIVDTAEPDSQNTGDFWFKEC